MILKEELKNKLKLIKIIGNMPFINVYEIKEMFGYDKKTINRINKIIS